MLGRFVIIAVFVVLANWAWTPMAGAQSPFLKDRGGAEESAAAIPQDLTPDQVDGMLARMTDAEIRDLLRTELARRAEEDAAEDTSLTMTLDQIEAHLSELSARIQKNITRWIKSTVNIQSRAETISDRLGQAGSGISAMIAAAVLVLAAGIAAAWLVYWMTQSWRAWLKITPRDQYWDRVLRTLALTLVDLLPIVSFLVAVHLSFAALKNPLGPLHTARLPNGGELSYVWIVEVGILYSWAFIVFSRRAFAPDAPAIRIAPIGDALANSLHRLITLAVSIGAMGWLLGGAMLNLGLGFPPVMLTRAVAGTAIAALLMIGLWRKRAQIRQATAAVFGDPNLYDASAPSMSRVFVLAAPWLLASYILLAWIYWLAHWLDRQGDRLEGPLGTLVIYLALPIFDRMGREMIQTILPPFSDLRVRLIGVFCGAWRLLIGFLAVLVIAWLWGVNILSLAKGVNAPAWASTVFDVIVTMLLGYLIWRLVTAALYTERKVSSASEDVDPSMVPAASRLNTLIPLFRNFMLGFLAIIITMIVLSSVGVDIGPLIASAGIIGIAIGFGAQSLVRDIFSGIFFLVDDAFRVGEYIELDTDLRGEVESISIRSLQLRHHRGPVITIPFGELKQITNHNRDWCLYKMSFRMEPDTDPQKFKKLVKNVGKEFMAHPDHGPKFLEPLKSQGVYYVDDDSALVMRVKFKCKPRAQFVLRREIYHRLRAVFAENDLRLARRKVEVVGSGGESVEDHMKGAADEAMSAVEPQAAPP
ncbi:MAG: mechanosensitive ion channel family protein [Pseudomonadota bacterium]